MEALGLFTPPVRAWFEASFPAPTAAQERGWKAIAGGSHTLIHAPTGSGKTLAAFLWALDRLVSEPTPPRDERCRVLYISPLKALAYDVDRNLRAPLAGIDHAASRLGAGPLPPISTFIRTGDTPSRDRQAMVRNPADILITTPESLFLMLTSGASAVLASVRWVIVDEVHAVAGTKRGAHLALSLERLEEVATRSPQRIGLSATQKPVATIAAFLGGGTLSSERRRPRPVEVVEAASPRPLELSLVVPVEDMNEPPPAPDPMTGEPAISPRSIWPAVHRRILDSINANRTTIVFANSRRLAERICAEINLLAGEEIARAHHGSVAREQRVEIEESLKRGELRAVVATSSLELGIDMGSVDLVIQVEAPISVASGLQRVGRSGHQVGGTARAEVYPKYRGDLLVATVMTDLMRRGEIEETKVPRSPLDVLAQQLVAAIAAGAHDADRLFTMVRRSHPFATLTRPVFDATLDMLAGRYPSDLFSELRPRITWDRVTGALAARPGARQLAIANAGTIPDRGLFRVTLPDGAKVGELDEEMVYESRVGDVFVLGATSWKVTDIGPDRVEVVPAGGETGGRMPFWKGDQVGRPAATGRAVGRFVREFAHLAPADAERRLVEELGLDTSAATNLVTYLRDQIEAVGVVPTDQTLVVERFRDEIGDWRLVLLSPYGARVHAPWAMAAAHRLREASGLDVDMIWSDDGIAFRFPEADVPPDLGALEIEPDEIEAILIDLLADTAMFGARFREAAGRALLLPRRRPGTRTPLWLQRRRAADLLSIAKQFGAFPIVLETYREILQDDFDLDALRELLAGISGRRIRLAQVDTHKPSPFAVSLLFSFVAAFMYEGDAPLAERRLAALTLDRGLLAELLGEGELREILSPEVVLAVELELQHLAAGRRVFGPDGVHDLLRDLGPLTEEDVSARLEGEEGTAILQQLLGERRIVEVAVMGSKKWIAIEDASRLRDALGVQPPPGVPHVFLEPVADPLGDVVGRYARTHGPFTNAQASLDLGLPSAVVDSELGKLEQAGRVTAGAFRQGQGQREWIDTEVLRRLKRRSLAALRRDVEPVEQAAVARFAPAWQRVGEAPPRGIGVMLETIRRLQGAELPASVLERDVLAARVAEPTPLLDRLLSEGELVWAGRGSLGQRDGRVALYLRDQLPLLWHEPSAASPSEDVHERLRAHLDMRGASFFRDLYDGVGGGDPSAVLDALWDLVWAGEVTNDTFAPVRALMAGTRPTNRGVPLTASFPASASGRWALLSHLMTDVEPTRRAAAWTSVLLDRHGLVTRSTVLAEGVPGGFAGIYPVLTQMEERGRVRRGYFVEGLGGAQFAMPGAVDTLRTAAAAGPIVLASTDPANPYGTTLPWPDTDSRVARDAGSYVFLIDGRLAAYLDRGGRNLRLFDHDMDRLSDLARGLASVAVRHRRFRIETVDGGAIEKTRLAPVLSEWGFVPALKGLRLRA